METEAKPTLAERAVGDIRRQALHTILWGLEKTGVLDRFAQDVRVALPGMINIHGLTAQFASQFLDLTREGYVPEVYIGHFNHLDPLVVSNACYQLIQIAQNENLAKNLNGFAVTIAKSIKEGRQSPLLKALYPHLEAYAMERGVEFVEYTRKADRRYKMEPTIADVRPLAEKLRKKGMGAILLTGGKVQPGRHPKGEKGDHIYGLQEITDRNLVDLYRLMERLGREKHQRPYFLSMIVDKTYRAFSSDTLLPTLEVLVSIYGDRFPGIVERLNLQAVDVDVTLGEINTEADMANKLGSKWRENPKEVNRLLMTDVARRLPPHARGFYGQFVPSEEKVAA